MTHLQCDRCKNQVTKGSLFDGTFKVICLAGGDIYASADLGERCKKEGEK